MTSPTVAHSPSDLRTSVTVPETGAGSSTVALSVSSTTTGWSRLTRSPALTSHWPIWTSVMDSPTSGMMSSMDMGTSLVCAVG